MQFTAGQIAMLVKGNIEGDASATVDSFGKIEEAKTNQLAFLANPKYEEYVYTTQASIIIINEAQELKQPVSSTLIRVPDAYSAFAALLHKYQEMVRQQMNGIQEPCYIHKSAIIGHNVFVGAFTYISENVQVGNNTKILPGVYLGDNVKVGESTILYPGVKIYHDCTIGKNATIHGGTVIGSDG